MAGDFSTWHGLTDAQKIVAYAGDSTGWGTATTNGGVCETCRRKLAVPYGSGGLGLQTLVSGALVAEDHWTISSGWTRATLASTFDVGPMLGSSLFGINGCVQLANVAAETALWTKPNGYTITGGIIHCVDGSAAGNFSWRVDGGAWTNVSHGWAGTNNVIELSIGTGFNSTFEVRGANAAGTAVNLYLIGFEPLTGSGSVIHNVCAPGERSTDFVRTTAGDWDRWFTTIAAPVVIIQWGTNDVVSGWNPAAFETRTTTMCNMVRGYGGEPILVNTFQADPATFDPGFLAEMRTRVKTVATNLDIYCVDFVDMVGDNAAALAAGYLHPDKTHPSNLGAHFMSQFIVAPLMREPGLPRAYSF